MSKDTKILIVGGGTFGLSTAWHLARNGYSNITILDKRTIPSTDSAAYDLNKIVRSEYADPLYTELGVEAREAWLSEPALSGVYRETGYIFGVTGSNKKSVDNWQKAVCNSRAQGSILEPLECPEDFRSKASVLTGPMRKWRGVYQPKAGYAHALDGLHALHGECIRFGIKIVCGRTGTAVKIIQDNRATAIGVQTVDGAMHHADKIILTSGAWIDSIIDMKGQLLPKCWCLVHIQLSQDERQQYKGMPVINNRELGYLFEPEHSTGLLKIAPHSPGYTWYDENGKSRPRSKTDHPSDGIPEEARAIIRDMLVQCMPDLANRPFVHEQMCWDADTPDANFLITQHPEICNLYIAGGASAHGYKFMPIIGKYIMQLIEGRLPPKLRHAWRWRPEQKPVQDTSRPDRPQTDLAETPGWERQQSNHQAHL